MNGLLARLVQDVTVFDGRPVISLCRCDPACVISLVMAAMVTVCVRCHGDCVCCHGDCELARLSNRGHYRLNTPNDRGPEVQSEDFARSSLFGPHIHITYGIQNAHKAGPRFGKVECV